MKVIVYSGEQCPWCGRVKEFLKENKIKFEEKDVGKDVKAREELIKKSGRLAVPVIDIDGEIVVGFNVPLLKHHLKI